MKRKRKFIKLAALFLVAMVLTSGMSAVTVSAETPYRTFTVNVLAEGRDADSISGA